MKNGRPIAPNIFIIYEKNDCHSSLYRFASQTYISIMNTQFLESDEEDAENGAGRIMKNVPDNENFTLHLSFLADYFV